MGRPSTKIMHACMRVVTGDATYNMERREEETKKSSTKNMNMHACCDMWCDVQNGKSTNMHAEEVEATCEYYPQSPSLSSFSRGGKFKSRNIPPRSSPVFFSARLCTNPSVVVLCRLIWPPKACPRANSCPQMEHRWTLGLSATASARRWSPAAILDFLWLARWPPSAWKEENCRLQVLHSNIRSPDDDDDEADCAKRSLSSTPPPPPPPPPRERSIKTWAILAQSISPPPIMYLFMSYGVQQTKLFPQR